MAAPQLEINGDFIDVPWAEFVGKSGQHGASWVSGYGTNNRATFEIIINWEDALLAEQDLLGLASFDPATGSLSRTLPAKHPIKPWMYCTGIVHMEPLAWDEKLDAFVDEGQGGVLGDVAVSQYRYMHLVLGFEVPPWNRCIDDTTLQNDYGGNEWNRFCIVSSKQANRAFSFRDGAWVWQDGPGNTSPPQPVHGEISGEIPSSRITVKWCRLPRAGLFGEMGASDFLNSNLLSSYGKVNGNATLWGMPANSKSGVLRLVDMEATPYSSPLTPTVQGLRIWDNNQYYDLTLVFHYWQPPAGNPASDDDPTTGYEGHNLAPYSVNNLWYLVGTQGNPSGSPPIAGGNTIYPVADLTTCFQLSAT